MTIYQGSKSFEPPQKTAMRAFSYMFVPRHEFFHKKHIVIASRACGDIMFLLDHGVPKKNIIACDIDSKARKYAQDFGVTVFPGGIVEATRWAIQKYGKTQIASINVDLCKTLSGTALPILNQVLQEDISKGTNVFFVYRRGRDRLTEKKREKIMSAYPQVELYNYQSYTKDSIGSPMCLALIRFGNKKF